MNHRRNGVVVNAVVVPVDEEHEVGEPQAPGGVARLVAGSRSQPAFAFHDEDSDLLATGQSECQRLTRRGRHAVARGPGVPLEEQGLALHFRVARQPLVAA